MIQIRTYSNYLAGLVAAIDGLDGFHLVAEDSHAVDRLRDKRGVHLLAVIPNAQTGGKLEGYRDNNSGYLFVLEKRLADATAAKELDQYEKTQNILLAIRDRIIEAAEDNCEPFWRLQVSSIQIDPEYNVFAGWNGYSMLFTF